MMCSVLALALCKYQDIGDVGYNKTCQLPPPPESLLFFYGPVLQHQGHASHPGPWHLGRGPCWEHDHQTQARPAAETLR